MDMHVLYGRFGTNVTANQHVLISSHVTPKSQLKGGGIIGRVLYVIT